ncbi:MAG TPA: carotenoid biosynthesis protein [Spirochaetia bacterium]|nr:carotenoid biosynthesis protein [Spirochaetia bacterium]
MSRQDWMLTSGLLAFFAVGLVGHLLPATRPLMVGLTPIALLVTSGIVAVPLVSERRARVGLWAAAAFAVGFGLEAIGVATGLVFGPYSYGTVLGPKLLGVPLVIGLNWPLVILGAVTLAARVAGNPLAAALMAGALACGFDWVLEPFAVSAGYWTWLAGPIPVRNYVAWFLTSMLLALAFTVPRLSVRSPVPSIAVAIQAVFFSALRLLGV